MDWPQISKMSWWRIREVTDKHRKCQDVWSSERVYASCFTSHRWRYWVWESTKFSAHSSFRRWSSVYFEYTSSIGCYSSSFCLRNRILQQKTRSGDLGIHLLCRWRECFLLTMLLIPWLDLVQVSPRDLSLLVKNVSQKYFLCVSKTVSITERKQEKRVTMAHKKR